MTEKTHNITRLLLRARCGDTAAIRDLHLHIYQEIVKVCEGRMKAERLGHTWRTSDLIQEAYLRLGLSRLLQATPTVPIDRYYLYGAIAQAVRRVLVDHARRVNAQRRGGSWHRHPLDSAILDLQTNESVDLVELDQALTRLAELNPRQAKIIELQFFAGLSQKGVAETLQVSLATIEKEWRKARTWLYGALCGSHDDA